MQTMKIISMHVNFVRLCAQLFSSAFHPTKRWAGVTQLRFKCESILKNFTLFTYFTTYCAKK